MCSTLEKHTARIVGGNLGAKEDPVLIVPAGLAGGGRYVCITTSMHSLPIAGAYNTSTLPAPCPLGFGMYTPLTKTSLQARMKWGRIFDMVRCLMRQVSIYATAQL